MEFNRVGQPKRLCVAIPPTGPILYPITEPYNISQSITNRGHKATVAHHNLTSAEIFLQKTGATKRTLVSIGGEGPESTARMLGLLFSEYSNSRSKDLHLSTQDYELMARSMSLDYIDAVVFPFTYLRMYSWTMRAISKLGEEIKKQSSAKVFVCGPGLGSPTHQGWNVIKSLPGIDTLVIGDEDSATEWILNSLEKHSAADKVIALPPTSKLQIGRLGNAFTTESHSRYINNTAGTQVLNLWTSRGCTGSCRFCNERIALGHYRTRCKDEIASDLEILGRTSSPHFIRLSDSAINGTREHLDTLVQTFTSHNSRAPQKLKWGGMARLDNLPDSTKAISMARESGLTVLWVGIESGNQNILDYLKKDSVTLEKINTLKQYVDAGIQIVGLFIKDAPWDTEESIQDTLNLQARLQQMGIYVCNSPYTPYSRTPTTKELINSKEIQVYAEDDILGTIWSDISYTVSGKTGIQSDISKVTEATRFAIDGKEIFTEV